jgi:hypothetical protein
MATIGGRRLAVVVGALLAAFGVAAGALGAKPSSTARPRCDRPFTSTLLATRKVRIYAMPKESLSPYEEREATVAGRPLFACLKATGDTSLLDLPEEGGGQHAYWVEVDPVSFAVRAPYVAYAFTEYYFDSHATWIRVRNLRTDAQPRSCEAGGGLAPGRLPQIGKIVLGSDLALAWTAKGYEGRSVRVCGAAGPRLLDAGEGIDLESLALKNGVVSWTDEGSVREAPLE